MNKDSKIYIAGHRGMVGSSLVRILTQAGYTNLVLRTSQELDLRQQADVEAFFVKEKPEYVFLAAAKVGGIYANDTYPADFIYDNLMIETNIIHAAYRHNVKKLLFLGSSCIYPKFASQPIKEEYLLTGALEPTNEAYALAKIAGLKMCQYYRRQYGVDFISAMPTNLYGPGDNYDLQNSHVIPAMLRKFHEAKMHGTDVTLWGSGSPRREFLYVDDLAQALVYLMLHYTRESHVNIGVGEDITIKDLALLIQQVVGHTGKILWDSSKPDGTPRKLLDVSKLRDIGFVSKTSLDQGLKQAYEWYVSHIN